MIKFVNIKQTKLHVITIIDKEYPPLLKEIYQPPWVLFTKGDFSLLENDPKLAVVGSRQATQYGKNAIRSIFPGLVEQRCYHCEWISKGN